jgi:outer membrane biogenesis lipoprotein LolB
VESVEGYATFRLARGEQTAKSKLAFVFRLPGEGRFEVIDPLGRTASILLLDGEEAYLVLPTRRAYWQSGRTEVMAKLLGFDMTLEDLSAILTGRADRLDGWALERDGQGRVFRGRSEGAQFEIRQFFESSPVPRLLVIIRDEDKGSLRILRMSFNLPLKGTAFERSFLAREGYRSVDWNEVEGWLQERSER